MASISEQIVQKKDYFEAQFSKLNEHLNLSQLVEIKEKAQMIQRNVELYSPQVRLAAFVPNKKQIVMHDMKFLT